MERKIKLEEIPMPLKNYASLILNKKPPYYDIVKIIVKEMEYHYQRAGRSETIYTINPRRLADEIAQLVHRQGKLTPINVSRTVIAFCRVCKLKEDEDFWVTTTARGRRNYHFKVNQHLLSTFSGMI